MMTVPCSPNPNPYTLNPEPWTMSEQTMMTVPSSLNPKPQTPSPEHNDDGALILEPEPMHPQSYTLNPEPCTSDDKSVIVLFGNKKTTVTVPSHAMKKKLKINSLIFSLSFLRAL